MIRNSIAMGVLALALVAPGASRADDAASTDNDASVEKVPGWSIKTEIEGLGTSMNKFNALIGSLSRANKDLSDEFAKYVKDPKNEVVASSLDRKLAAYAAQVQGEFSAVISEQDALSSNFRLLRRKLQDLSTRIGAKAGDFEARSKGFADKARTREKALIALAVKLKESPPEDPDELKKLKHEFLVEQRRYALEQRYAKGYQARVANYQQLRKNLDKLGDLFVTLHERFGDLMENLSNEKHYLHDSIELQADTLEIKRIIREGIFGGENTIKGVSDKLASLFVKVDAFTQVHERIGSDLNNFVAGQAKLAELSGALENLGGRDLGQAESMDLEKAIDEAYKKKDAPLTNDDAAVLGGTR